MRVYLAGKISRQCWRHSLVVGLKQVDGLDDWPVLAGAVDGGHDYVGPFFGAMGHGCSHGEDTHGVRYFVAVEGPDGEESFFTHSGCIGGVVVEKCLAALRTADVVFAWIDSLDCYGTIAEIGFAIGIGIPVLVAGPRRFRDMWFLYMASPFVRTDFLDPVLAFRVLMGEVFRPASQGEVCKRCGRRLSDHESVSSGLGPRCAAVIGRGGV